MKRSHDEIWFEKFWAIFWIVAPFVFGVLYTLSIVLLVKWRFGI